MPIIDLVIESKTSQTPRVRSLEAMFDVPFQDTRRLEWRGELPIEMEAWNIGLIVGPSGCGKSVIANKLWGVPQPLDWKAESVIDDFSQTLSMQDITIACSSVGFNTIPAWMRPYAVLSNGEKFRVELARRILENESPIVIDEFTSVVDRQVAQVGSHAVQKYIRKTRKQFVAVSCHYDIIDWLQPDWIFEPSTMLFTRRCLRRRPELDITIAKVHYETWRLFAPFHYLTAELNKTARCYALFVGDKIASFAGVIHKVHPKTKDIKGVSRQVTLPDWQGLGLAFVLADALGAAYKALGLRLHHYPAHPTFIRAFDKSDKWAMTKRPGKYDSAGQKLMGTVKSLAKTLRPCAVFEYVGPAMDKADAERLIQ